MKRFTIALLLAAAAPTAAFGQAPPASTPTADAARGSFTFDGWHGPALRVFYQLPPVVRPDTPVLIAIHGVNRDADTYRDAWARYAVERGFIVVAPEFSKANFPDNESFSSGGMEQDGAPVPRDRWTFAAIDPLFDAVKARFGSQVPGYVLYGHSGGAQFVQRFVTFMPEARFTRAIAANAGWYTMPDFDTRFPYGLKDTTETEAGLKAALQRPLWILLGSEDTNPRSPNLRTTREAEKQGPYRRARGDSYYKAAQAEAERLGVPLKWQRRYVNGVGHDNLGMTAAAVVLVAPRQ